MTSWRANLTAARLRAAFIAASVAWAVLLVAAPFLASCPHASTLASALIVGVYGIGSLICHQLPERSYHLWAAQMPVCARCTGIYVGAVLGALGARPLRVLGARAFQPPLALRRSRLLLALAVTPTLATLAYEWSTGEMPSHAIRAAAGIPIGLVAAWLVVAAADNQVN
jgi:uncharacterized membrane protein